MNFLTTEPLHVLIAGGLLALLVLAFCGLFLAPGLVQWWRLRQLQACIARFESRTPPGEFRKLFARDPRLAHLWKEYQDTLHTQRETRDGQQVPVAVRATLPAETYFNSQYVVDARLRTDFFKHLPGIFTGIGIIGTFTGLIEGLRQFQVSDNAATVRASLESLMHSVGQAFLVSATAIAAAMVITFLEKLLLASLYARVEEIAHEIDARFDTGAGEDYLSRLVKVSEDSAGQARTLKDALVQELGALMREQTAAQAGAARAEMQRLGTTIAESIAQSLDEPLKRIASAVGTAAGDQSTQATQMLEAVMGRFGQQLEATLGGQASGLGELNQQAGQTLQDSVRTLRELVSHVAESGRETTDAVTRRMADAMEKMDARQARTDQQLASMLASLGDTQRQAADGHREREQAMSERSALAMGAMSGTVEQAIQEMSAASAQMARSVDALTQVTTGALDKMTLGADQLGSASLSFAAAGERVSGVMGQASLVSAQLAEASGTLVGSTAAMQEGLADYRGHREAVSHLVTELRTTMELARKEASLTADVLSRIQRSTERLGEAQQQADRYLSGVSKVLGDAHQAFAIAVRKSLELANGEFHTKLSTAVGLLSSTVVELEATLGVAAPRSH